MAEIAMLKRIWDHTKIQLCWWHLCKAVRECLSKGKLATTPYDPSRAKQEFPFINVAFWPLGDMDPDDIEGGTLNDPQEAPATYPPRPHALTLCIPTLTQQLNIKHQSIQQHMNNSASTPGTTDNTNKENVPVLKLASLAPQPMACHTGIVVDTEDNWGVPRLTIRLPLKANCKIVEDDTSDDDESRRRTFCRKEFWEDIIYLMEQHLCAHPLIPGYAHPSPAGIREWAVKQMYNFCVASDLCELWAYLWGNWYQSGHWELWARSVYPEIPVLKTTMILESQ